MCAIALFGCGKTDQPKESLSGTIWVASLSSSEKVAIEFVGSSSVKTYRTDDDLSVFEKTIRTGIFSTSGDSITFSGLTYFRVAGDVNVLSGVINGGHLSVNVKYHLNSLDKDVDETISFTKKR